MDRNETRDMQHHREHLGMNTPPMVSRQEWEAARQQMLVKEKALMRARDALAAERRRVPWMAVEKAYEHVSAVTGGGFHDLPSHPSAAADHDHQRSPRYQNTVV
jgi:Bacterial protein of unknown function (DUF899)